MKHIFLLLLGFLVAGPISAQNLKYCGSDEMAFELYHNNPDLQATMQANREALKTFTQNYIAHNMGRGNPDSLYTIPVVLHVIHTYGSENISDEEIMSGLKVLNWNFRKQNPDTATIVPDFKSIAADCEIEFKLAHLDPDGHCTSGINRIASPYSNIGDHSVKSLIHWDPSKYFNIYVVKQIASLAGHCLMPDQAAAKPEWDGMVIANDYVGDIGTSSDLTSVVLAHESGHYLNLFHIWGGNNVPGYYYLPVGQPGNCDSTDEVDDTPPTIGWSTCNLNASSCGNAVDNVQNAMDYTYCNFMFTQGQRARMRATLHSPIANRNNLITPQNLVATGVNMTTLCKSAFIVNQNVVCDVDTVFFTDKSIATPDSWLWNFGDGSTSTLQHTNHVYYATGDFYVTLTATKGSTTVTSDTMVIRVNSSIANNVYYVQGFENLNTFADAQLFNTTDNNNLRFTMADAGQGFRSSLSAVLRIPDTTVAYSGRTTLISPTINLGNVSLPALTFQYAFSQKVINSNDVMEVFLSNDCGKTWVSKSKKFGTNLRTVSTVQTDQNWAPLDSSQWKTMSFAIPQAYAVSDLLFKINVTNYQGNALYIDNININQSAYTGIQKIELTDIELMPNPAKDVITITGLQGSMNYRITDINGKVWLSNVTSTNAQAIDISQLSAGVYHIMLEDETSFAAKRFIKY